MKKIILFMAMAVLLAGCTKATATKETRVFAEPKMALKAMVSNSFAMADRATVVEEAEYAVADDAVAGSGAENGAVKSERKLVYTGYMNLEVKELAEAKSKIEEWIKKFGGYISSSNQNESSINFSVKIPCEKFDEAMSDAGNFGKLKNKSINTRDVTEQFYDLESRLKTRRVLLERMNDYLKNAQNMKDLIQIETKINDVTGELERTQSQMNRLKNQIEYSQIDLYITLPANTKDSGFILPDIGSKTRIFVGNIARFFVQFFYVALYIVIFGTPTVLLAMLLYWLCFGKIGLLKKLFKKIK